MECNEHRQAVVPPLLTVCICVCAIVCTLFVYVRDASFPLGVLLYSPIQIRVLIDTSPLKFHPKAVKQQIRSVCHIWHVCAYLFI